MKGTAEFVFETKEPLMVYRALAPERDDEVHRSGIDLSLSEGSIGLKIHGDDPASLRAALNTWIRLVKIAFEMVDV
ncbi:MAG: Transcription factor Pcc1 [Methanosaeta sp. PtaU1.Bin060]|jgi:KEOPS complex subunit Pcc1|nr:MAG: Transcription factor Pcc1 [Methanosaeta sp. PtaU1.Bin060]